MRMLHRVPTFIPFPVTESEVTVPSYAFSREIRNQPERLHFSGLTLYKIIRYVFVLLYNRSIFFQVSRHKGQTFECG